MKITSTEFVIGAMSKKQFPKTEMPEIVFAGRSNVGKSSLINGLLGRKNLARIGKSPGKTRQINFYEINKTFRFVDLPGYGYAKVSKKERNEWQNLIESYLTESKFLTGSILLIDARHPKMSNDIMLWEYLFSLNMESLLVTTKVDKLSGNDRAKLKVAAKKNFNVEPVLFSAVNKRGRDEVWNYINSVM